MDRLRYCHSMTCDRLTRTATSCECGFTAHHLSAEGHRASQPKPGTSGVYDILRDSGQVSLHVVQPMTPATRSEHARRVESCRLE